MFVTFCLYLPNWPFWYWRLFLPIWPILETILTFCLHTCQTDLTFWYLTLFSYLPNLTQFLYLPNFTLSFYLPNCSHLLVLETIFILAKLDTIFRLTLFLYFPNFTLFSWLAKLVSPFGSGDNFEFSESGTSSPRVSRVVGIAWGRRQQLVVHCEFDHLHISNHYKEFKPKIEKLCGNWCLFSWEFPQSLWEPSACIWFESGIF